MARRSAKSAAQHRERMVLVRSMAGPTGRMLCTFPEGCGREATAVDERVLRSQLKNAAVTEDIMQPLCTEHHEWKHANPLAAEAAGVYERGASYRRAARENEE